MRLATVSVSTVAGLGLLRWYLDPAGSTRWMWLGLFLPMVWGYIELAQSRGVNEAFARQQLPDGCVVGRELMIHDVRALDADLPLAPITTLRAE